MPSQGQTQSVSNQDPHYPHCMFVCSQTRCLNIPDIGEVKTAKGHDADICEAKETAETKSLLQTNSLWTPPNNRERIRLDKSREAGGSPPV